MPKAVRRWRAKVDHVQRTIVVTHKVDPAALGAALAELPGTAVLVGAPVAIRIENV